MCCTSSAAAALDARAPAAYRRRRRSQPPLVCASCATLSRALSAAIPPHARSSDRTRAHANPRANEREGSQGGRDAVRRGVLSPLCRCFPRMDERAPVRPPGAAFRVTVETMTASRSRHALSATTHPAHTRPHLGRTHRTALPAPPSPRAAPPRVVIAHPGSTATAHPRPAPVRPSRVHPPTLQPAHQPALSARRSAPASRRAHRSPRADTHARRT